MVFTAPSTDERAAWLARVGEPGAHDDIAAGSACLQDVDLIAAAAGASATDHERSASWLRVAAWNAERGRHLDGSIELLRRVDADLVLLSEVDVGMARSGNHDVARELAGALGYGGAFAVEFVELSLGDAADVAAAETLGEDHNAVGLHGNAVLSRRPLVDACVVRLDDGGDWFTLDRGQPRVGGRVAVAARLGVAMAGDEATAMTVASVHLESSSTAAGRAAQLDALLGALDDRFGHGPAVVGGDCNTFGSTLADLTDRSAVQRLRRDDPTRFTWPVPYEPLFEVAASRGYDWTDANVAAPTTRHGADGLPDHVALKLDWILVRGLEARRATVVPAVDGVGQALSDHDVVAVSVRLPGRI